MRSVADVIEGAALHDGRVEGKEGLASAAASLITLSTGGSTGREGPAVHIAAMISSEVCEWVNARGITARDLLGCATGAAVAASFNAPIAGALFALEVILRHFALHAFAPIVIASVAGAVVHQIAFGDQVEFNLPLAPDLQFFRRTACLYGIGFGVGCCGGYFDALHLFGGYGRIGYPRSPDIAALVASRCCGCVTGPNCDTVSRDHRGWI